MATRDWALVAFTLLTQAAVGGFLTLLVLQRLAARGGGRGGAEAGGGARTPSAGTDGGDGAGGRFAFAVHATVLAVLSVGLFAALFHLSDPLQAPRAVLNFGSSWLSREIVFGSLFALLLAMRVAGEWRTAEGRAAGWSATGGQAAGNRGAAGDGEAAGGGGAAGTPPGLAWAQSPWLAWGTAAAGLAFLVCQTAIYLLPAQPAWNSFATPAAFGGSALRLGLLGVAAGVAATAWQTATGAPRGAAGAPAEGADGDVSPGLQAATGAPRGTAGAPAEDLRERKSQPPAMDAGRDGAAAGPLWRTLRGLALVAAAAVALEFVALPLQLQSLAADGSPAAAASLARLTDDYGGILLLRMALLGAAAAGLGAVFARRRPLRPLPALVAVGAAFDLVFVSEVCGRFLFYAMQVRVGI